MTTAIAKTLEVFRKRTPEEKQKYIMELARENNRLRYENEQYRDYVIKTKTYFRQQNNLDEINLDQKEVDKNGNNNNEDLT